MTAPRRTVTVLTRAGELRVIYRPSWITVSDFDDAEKNRIGSAARLILATVAHWNIGNADGERVGINAAGVALLSEKLTLDIAHAIIVDYRAVVAADMKGMTAA